MESFNRLLREAMGVKTPANDVVPRRMIPGGKALGLSLSEIAARHGLDADGLRRQVEKGLDVEMEHTDDSRYALNIVYDHLVESPVYYDALSKMEDELKSSPPKQAV